MKTNAGIIGLAFLIIVAGLPALSFELVFVSGSPQVYSQPHDLVLSPDGRLLYVTDNNANRIAVLDPATLELRGTFGEGEVGAPHAVALDARGRLLVADTDHSRIAIFKSTNIRERWSGNCAVPFDVRKALLGILTGGSMRQALVQEISKHSLTENRWLSRRDYRRRMASRSLQTDLSGLPMPTTIGWCR